MGVGGGRETEERSRERESRKRGRETETERYTVRTVAADLRRGEHIPKMQNNIGHKSTLRVLRQLRSKDGGEAGCRTVPCHAVPRRAALGPSLGCAQLP